MQVYKATRTSDGKLVALKCIKQEDGDGKGFPVTAIREMRILRQLRHKVRGTSVLTSLIVRNRVGNDGLHRNQGVQWVPGAVGTRYHGTVF